eukprot:7708178-Ditylum_brightwellii.AAC.1
MSFIRDVLLPTTSENVDGKVLTVGELFVYIGLWLVMASLVTSCKWKSWFESTKPLMWEGASFWLSQHMTGYVFEQITNALTFTLTPPPTFRD